MSFIWFVSVYREVENQKEYFFLFYPKKHSKLSKPVFKEKQP